jgi:hypothetical protein
MLVPSRMILLYWITDRIAHVPIFIRATTIRTFHMIIGVLPDASSVNLPKRAHGLRQMEGISQIDGSIVTIRIIVLQD